MESEVVRDPRVLEEFQHIDGMQAPSFDGKHAVQGFEVVSDTDANIVDFEADDPENPLNWPRWRKWIVLSLVSMLNTLGFVWLCQTLLPSATMYLFPFIS